MAQHSNATDTLGVKSGGLKLTQAKRGPAPKIQQQLEEIEALPKAKQRVVNQMIDAMLQANASGQTKTPPVRAGFRWFRTNSVAVILLHQLR